MIVMRFVISNNFSVKRSRNFLPSPWIPEQTNKQTNKPTTKTNKNNFKKLTPLKNKQINKKKKKKTFPKTLAGSEVRFRGLFVFSRKKAHKKSKKKKKETHTHTHTHTQPRWKRFISAF